MNIVDTMVVCYIIMTFEQVEHFTHNVRRATGLGRAKLVW